MVVFGHVCAIFTDAWVILMDPRRTVTSVDSPRRNISIKVRTLGRSRFAVGVGGITLLCGAAAIAMNFGILNFGSLNFGILKQDFVPQPHPSPHVLQQSAGAQHVASTAPPQAAGAQHVASTGAQQVGSAATPQAAGAQHEAATAGPQPLPPLPQPAGAQQLASTGAQQVGSTLHPQP